MCAHCMSLLHACSSKGSNKPLSRFWGYYSAACSFLAFLAAIAFVTRVDGQHWHLASLFARVMTYILYTVCIPIWLVWLCFQLRARSDDVAFASIKEVRTSTSPNSGQAVEMQSAGQAADTGAGIV